jgi:acyl dehydratase
MAQPQHVDRSFARLVAYKRIMTGSLSLAASVVLSIAVALHGSAPPLAYAAAMVIFVGGGLWTLRDGLRLRRELRQ